MGGFTSGKSKKEVILLLFYFFLGGQDIPSYGKIYEVECF